MSAGEYDVYGRSDERASWVIAVVGCDLEYAAQFQARCERDPHLWAFTTVVAHGSNPA
jgi:hypothetical protein